jgi:hypothetical protein
MSEMMAVLLNGVAQLEYDRGRELPAHQAVYLDKMDRKMDEGIVVGEETVSDPSLDQRAQFVAANLVHAIKSDDEQTAAAMCTYLANRLPDLKQVKIEDKDGQVMIDLVFDEEYKKQVMVQLH